MVTNKGISYAEIVDQGLGYTANDVVDIDDLSGNGQGAEARLRVDGNGAILEVIIDNPGRDYVNPSISVTRASITGRDANVTAHLVNPFGDVFLLFQLRISRIMDYLPVLVKVRKLEDSQEASTEK